MAVEPAAVAPVPMAFDLHQLEADVIREAMPEVLA
jgi:hypothetical protein